MSKNLNIPLWLGALLAPLAGVFVPLTLAPYDIWPLGLLGVGLLALITLGRTGRQCLWLAFLFGMGMYGLGASWVFVSIHTFGNSPFALALLLTALFVAGLSLAFSLPFWVYGRWLSRLPYTLLLGFPAIWALDEWMRSWLLTGFPWLYLGYGHLQTPLAGWAPVLGVFGVGLSTALTACVAVLGLRDALSRRFSRQVQAGAVAVAIIWGGGFALKSHDWTTLDEKPISIGMAQPSIPQERKWDPAFLPETFRIFRSLSRDLWQYDWVIWPEAAIPLMYHEAESSLVNLAEQADRTHSVFITGILYDELEQERYYNSIVALGQGSGISYKTRLVPFGEYVPLESLLRGMIEFFDLPTSIIHPGPSYENGLLAGEYTIAPSICYEVVYPDLVAERAVNSHVLLTVSNDAWFGRSIGPVQHFQMAQMRALETGRYMVRSTNNGLSGIIDPKGRIVVQGNRYTRESITGEVYAAYGNTPFLLWQSWPSVALCFAMIALLLTLSQRRRFKNTVSY